MATARAPGGQTPTATIGFDYSQLRNAPNVARQAAQATAREMNLAFRAIQTEQRLAMEQTRQTTVILRQEFEQVRGLQQRLTASARTQSQERIAQARTESMAQQQSARVAANTAIEEERRKTAAFKAELRQRQQSSNVGGFARGATGAALGAMGGPIGAIAGAAAGGALPAAAGLALVEGARFAVEATKVATSYERQRVAAINLVGSQAKLNEMMDAYKRATGGAIDQAESLSNVTKLVAVGFGDSAKELEQFARAIRGISIAMGTSQDTVTQNLILELFSQRGQRLDQLGLKYVEVRKRAAELRAEDSTLTEQQAYQNAVLQQAEQRFGKLADSAAGQATGLENAGKAWKDFGLAVGTVVKPTVDFIGNLLAKDLERETERWKAYYQVIVQVGTALGMIPRQMPDFPLSISGRTGIGAGARETPQHFDRQLSDPQRLLTVNRFNALNQVGRGEGQAILDVTRATSEQRASIIRQYELSSSREAEDFARQRLLAERKLAMSILDVAQDSARQRVRWEAETERTINEARIDRDERIAEARADSAKRVAEIEEKFAKDQEKRANDHRKRLREAAANLDAVAVREEQIRYRDEKKERKEAHQEQLADEGKSLQKRTDEINKAFAKQEADQRASLQRRIDQQKEDDELRIQQMKDAFADQVAQEDIERGIRLGRQAEDHGLQLAELDRQNDSRIEQIRTHAQRERDQIEEEFTAGMVAEGARWSARFLAYEERQLQLERMAIDSVNRFYVQLLGGGRGQVQGPQPQGSGNQMPSISNPFPFLSSAPGSGSVNNNSRSITVGDVFPTIVIGDAGGRTDAQIEAIVINSMGKFFDGMLPQ